MKKTNAETPADNLQTEPKAWADGIPVYCSHDAIVAVSDLIPNPENPNRHPAEQVKKLGGVIRGNGWRQPITVSTRSGMIVKGHGRLLAAQLEELKEAPVDYQNYDSEAAELADLWADNYIAELAETDQQLAANLLAGIQTAGAPLELAGSSQEEYDAIVDALTAGSDDEEDEDPEDEGEDLDDEAGEVPEEPVTIRGDVWILGRHRVMCGDATSKRDVDELLNGAQPEILITDPPYCSGGFQEGGAVHGVDRDDPDRQERETDRGEDRQRHTEHPGLSEPHEGSTREQSGDGRLYLYRLANVGISLRHRRELRSGGEVDDRLE